MALERLQSVFNDIYQNEARSTDDSPSPSIDQIGDDHSYGSNGFFDSINQVLQPDGTYQRYGNIPIRASADASPMSRKLLLSQEEPSLNYSGYENENGVTVRDVDGISRLYEGLIPVGEEGESIRHFYDKGENIGKKNLLGVKGSGYELSDIFDPTHGSNTPTKSNVFRGQSTRFLDIRESGDQSGFNEPFIVKPIADEGKDSIKGGYNRDILPYNATADDLLRFGKFYTTSKGLYQIARENLINIGIGDGSFKLGRFNVPNPLRGIMAPPIPFPNTGLLSILHSSVQGASLIPGGGSARKPFRIQYSERHSLGLPFKNLGDKPIGIGVLKNIKLPSPEGKTGAKATFAKLSLAILKPLKEKGIAEAKKLMHAPKIKKTPFIDLNHGSSKTTYDDKISNKTAFVVEDEKVKWEEENINKGDFYVRIKDLRNGNFIYFRGFVTGINENITPSWNPTQYIGRSEDVWNYQKAERDLSFNLKVYPFNVSEFNFMYDKIELLTSLAYPSYLDAEGGGSTRMNPPFTELYMAHIGTRAEGQFGYIKSLTYTVPDGGDWDSESALPRMFDIAISYQILSKRPPALRDKSIIDFSFYGANKTIIANELPPPPSLNNSDIGADDLQFS